MVIRVTCGVVALLCAMICPAWAQWEVGKAPLQVVKAMQVPEAVCCDPITGVAYVSNIVGAGWEQDNTGFISRLKAEDGSLDVLRWREKAAQSALSAPKGMCIYARFLYVADIDRVHRFSLAGEESATLIIPAAKRLNDMASDGKDVYVSDTERGCVYRVSHDMTRAVRIGAVPGLNGITFYEGKCYGVSWSEHEVYELDLTGEKLPQAFGVAQHFKSLDGIEVLPGGCFVVSDFLGNKVALISPDRKTVKTLLEVKTPADITVDRQRGRLFVPEFQGDEVAVYELRRA